MINAILRLINQTNSKLIFVLICIVALVVIDGLVYSRIKYNMPALNTDTKDFFSVSAVVAIIILSIIVVAII
jgi:hypothetical protein